MSTQPTPQELFETTLPGMAAKLRRETMNGKPVFTVPSKTVLNLESGFAHKLLCDGPTFSTGSACVYSCAFCYVPDMTRKQRPFLERQGVTGKHEDVVIRREGALEILRRELAQPKARALADKPLVIYSSPSVDVAGNMDLVRETALACHLILTHTRWHIRLLSKSNLLPKIAEALGNEAGAKARMIYGVSTGTLDDGLAKAFEAGTPLVSKRIQSLHWLQDRGFRTYGMICPSLPQPGGIGEMDHYLEFSRAAAAAIRADRCEHVWAEVINLRGDSFTRTISALRDAGFAADAKRLEDVHRFKNLWEEYAVCTFESHAATLPAGKLRFLQYPAAGTRARWEKRIPRGAVLL